MHSPAFISRLIRAIIRLTHCSVALIVRVIKWGTHFAIIAFLVAAIYTVHDSTPAPDERHCIDIRDHASHHYITTIESSVLMTAGIATVAFCFVGGAGISFCEWIERKFPPNEWGYLPVKKANARRKAEIQK